MATGSYTAYLVGKQTDPEPMRNAQFHVIELVVLTNGKSYHRMTGVAFETAEEAWDFIKEQEK